MDWADLKDDSQYESQNAEVIEHFKDKKVNVSYDRVLSATPKNDGTWDPRAYVVSLPYDYDFSEYNEADQARIYRLRFKEEYYKQFIFLPDAAKPNLMQAGRAYLVVVMKGTVDLSATGVSFSNAVVDDEQNVVNSFEDWYFEDKFTPVGKWQANFRSISDVEANAPAESAAPKRAAALPGTYKTMFQMSEQQGANTGENVDYEHLDYEGVIPFVDVTGIKPTIRAIDADGTSRYFDLQGRLLNGKPERGLYIENGKKVIR